MRTKWLSLVLALCLLLSAIPTVTAEDEAFSAPVDGTVEEVAKQMDLSAGFPEPLSPGCARPAPRSRGAEPMTTDH